MKVAVAPVLSDIPIIVLTLYVLTKLSNSNTVLGIISFLGAVFLLYLGIENFRVKGLLLNHADTTSKSFTKGLVVNALNPHPYLFWLTIGAPIAKKHWGIIPSLFRRFWSFFMHLLSAQKSFWLFWQAATVSLSTIFYTNIS